MSDIQDDVSQAIVDKLKVSGWNRESCADSGDHSSFITRISGAKHVSARRGSTLRRPRNSAGPVDDVHSLTYTVFMKNITLSVDEKVLAAVRRYAAERDSSVNGMVREYLEKIAVSEDRARQARLRIRELSKRSRARIGAMAWKRDELHDR